MSDSKHFTIRLPRPKPYWLYAFSGLVWGLNLLTYLIVWLISGKPMETTPANIVVLHVCVILLAVGCWGYGSGRWKQD